MAEFPCFPLWTDSYLADTTHLTTIEHGAYFLLLMAMWRSKTKTLVHDDVFLSRIVKMTPQQWQRIKPIMMGFFDDENGYLSNGRLSDEAEAVKRKSNRQSDKAKARWLKTKETNDATAMPRECPSDASLNLTLNTNHSVSKDTLEPFNLFNDLAVKIGLPAAQKITKPRKSKMALRLKDIGGIEGWKVVLEKIENSPFLRGENKSGWKADIDFILQESSIVKIMEGKYDGTKQTNTSPRDELADFLATRRH